MSVSAGDFELDAIVWVSCDDVVWRPGRVVPSHDASQQEETISVELESSAHDDPTEEAEVIQVRVGMSSAKKKGPQLLRRNVALLGDGALKHDDLTEVPELHEAAVLHALDVRFAHGYIYTLTGSVLLAVNPFRTIPNLYSPEVLQSFLTGSGNSSSALQRPHIFGTTSRALRGIREKAISQTILISGESGAGKTESTKFVMQFLALAGSVDPKQQGNIGQHGMSRVEKQVLGSNPLLEAFGNAKTRRNDNSSRFGKFIELQFSPPTPPSGGFFADEAEQQAAPRLDGARIRTYLLEKVRVIRQQEGERSFHIFYQALAAAKTPERLAAAGKPLMAATEEQVAQFHGIGMTTRGGDNEVDLDGFVGFGLSSFSYLLNAKPGTLAGVNEADEFEATLSAMRTVGLTPQETSDIFHTLAAVLHIGNIKFARIDGGESSEVDKSDTSSLQALQIASRLLCVDAQDLERALCKKTRQRNTDTKQVVESIVTNVTADKAEETRDALARHAYHAVFSHVVARTNESIGYRERALYCGVLDIFGFEFFEKNSFEQLCINYTNELLQQFFNTFIFENEIALYKEEGISWKDLTFPDNCKIVDLLKKTQTSIFPALDNECYNINGASKTWCNNMIKEHEKHTNFSFVKQRPGEFIIHHFAGPVTYTAEEFLDKNKDELSRDVLQCLQGSRSAFVSKRFLEQGRVFGVNTTDGGSQKVTKAKRYTVSAEFREQLDDLMARIRETAPHFVRCIKSNPANKPYVDDEPVGTHSHDPNDVIPRKPRFDRKVVVEQLSYQGVLEAIRVARSGYPVRFQHHEFLTDFRCLAGAELQARLKKALQSDESNTANLVQQLLACSEIKELLEKAKFIGKTPDVAGPIGWAVGKTRIFLKLDQFNFLKSAQVGVRHASAVKLQSAWRCKVEFRRFCMFRAGMMRMQAKIRGALVRNKLWRQKRELAATSIGVGFRTLLERSQLNRMRQAARVLQNFERRNSAKKRCRAAFLKSRAHAIQLQRWWRSVVKRRRWRNFQKNVLLIQRVCRGALGRRKAAEQLALRRCLVVAGRKTFRIWRKKLEYRAWRMKAMQSYRQQRTMQPSFDHDTLASGTLKLWQKDQAQEFEIAQLRESNRRLEEQCESLGYYAWLRFRRCFNSEPMPIPQ